MQYLTKKLSFTHICVSTTFFCFQSYFGRPFHGAGRENFFQKNPFYKGTNFVEKIYRGIVLHGGLTIRLRGKEFYKMFFPTVVEYSLQDKALTII